MRAAKTIYDVGRTQFGQRLTLEHHCEGYNNGWRLVQHASSQRDETETIYVTELIAAAILDKFR